MEYLKPGKTFHWMRPVIVPLEPVTKPSPIITPAPSHDDPFNVPAPKINPTIKGFDEEIKIDL